MLREIEKLNIVNEGYKHNVSLSRIYVNVDNIVSIANYDGAHTFLLSEGITTYSNKSFSLIKINLGKETEEIIALGSAAEIHAAFYPKDRGLLNG